MMNKKRPSRLIFLLGAAGLALSVFFCPAANLPAQAALPSEDTAEPQRDAIGYRFTIFGCDVYKRLYNYSTCNWIGDWIYVCTLPEDKVPTP